VLLLVRDLGILLPLYIGYVLVYVLVEYLYVQIVFIAMAALFMCSCVDAPCKRFDSLAYDRSVLIVDLSFIPVY